MSMGLQRLGKYELREQLGRGNAGEVWKAYDLQLRREVALKILHTDHQADPHFFTRFTQEGQVLASLHHTNIVQIHDVALSRPQQEEHNINAYIVMEYVEGQTLTDYINATVRKGIFFTPDEIVYLFTSLGVAIDYAHQKGIIHGNIKPSNILFDRHNTAQLPIGEPMLTDFALNRLLGDGSNVVSPYYISPEQAKGNPPGARSDIYALGVILYELCTGVQPFRDESSVAVMMQHISTLPTPPALINPNVPPALSETILRAMAKDTATRFSMASLMATAIADAYSIQNNTHISSATLARLRAEEAEEAENLSNSQPRLPILGIMQPSLKLPSRRSGSLPSIQPITRSQPLPLVPHSQPSIAAQGPSQQTSKELPAMPIAPRSPAITRKIPVTPITFISDQQPTNIMPSTAATSSGPLSPTPIQVPQQQMVSTVPPFMMPKKRLARFANIPRPLYIIVALIVLLLIILGISINNLFAPKSQTSITTPNGYVFFQDDPLGHEDVLRIEIQPIQTPAQGDSDIVWLQTTNNTTPLGSLTIQNGTGDLLYQGNAHHTNLLSVIQRVIVTQEKSANLPAKPQGKTLYIATLNSVAFTYVRNILYVTPGLPNNSSVLYTILDAIKSMSDKSASIVDSLHNTHDYGLAQRQAIRIIELLDGTKYAQQSGDLPATDAPELFTSMGLLSSPTQKGYLDLLDQQLTLLQQHAGNNPALLAHVRNVRNAVADLKNWLQKARSYDVQILKATNLNNSVIMSDALQLRQLVANSYTGLTIPPNDGPMPTLGSAGAYQGYVEALYLATLDMKAA